MFIHSFIHFAISRPKQEEEEDEEEEEIYLP